MSSLIDIDFNEKCRPCSFMQLIRRVLRITFVLNMWHQLYMLCLSFKAFVNGLCVFSTCGSPQFVVVQWTLLFTTIRRALSEPLPCTLPRLVVRILLIAQHRECLLRYP